MIWQESLRTYKEKSENSEDTRLIHTNNQGNKESIELVVEDITVKANDPCVGKMEKVLLIVKDELFWWPKSLEILLDTH